LLLNGRICAIELGVPGQQQHHIFERPTHVQEFVMCSICSSGS
jgi:hypothetical protein